MDIRIVNTCNNACLYCLESSLRKRQKYIELSGICIQIEANRKDDNILNFYGGNPLLHPELKEIINFGRENGYLNISLLTNGYSLDTKYLERLIESGLTGIGLYFHCFDSKKHATVSGSSSLNLKQLLQTIELSNKYDILSKIVIHVNTLNIKTLYKDIYLLFRKYGVMKFEFVNYFPFDRAYEHIDVMGYDIKDVRKEIGSLFSIIEKLGISVRFLKFPKVFFGEYIRYYDYEEGIERQIGDEDKKRLDVEILGKEFPSCFEEKRCKYCFIQDNCKFYGL